MNVLVADDDFANLETLSSALVSAGHRVLRAGDGGDALRILTKQLCDVVVCDDDMPVLDGPQLVGAMQATARLAGIPVIVMVDAFNSRARSTRSCGRRVRFTRSSRTRSCGRRWSIARGSRRS